MTALVLVGAAVITIAVALLTFWYFGLLYMSIGMAGWDCVKDGLVPILVVGFGVVLSWVFWWFVVGAHIHIGVS